MVQGTKLVAWFVCGMGMLTPYCAWAEDPDAESSDQELTPTVPASMHWQLGIALNGATYQRVSFDVEPINSGRPMPGLLDRTNYGPSGGPVLVEAGYVLSNRLVLGLMLDFGSGLNETKVEDINFGIAQSAASFAVGPRAAYLFASESRLRPFALVAFGYTNSPSKQLDQALRITVYQGFAGAGASYFLTPAFSIDTSVRAAYGIGSGYVDAGVLKNASLSGSVVTLMWLFGTSGWLK